MSKEDKKDTSLGIEAFFYRMFPEDLAEQLIRTFASIDLMSMEKIRTEFLKLDVDLKKAITDYMAVKGHKLLDHWIEYFLKGDHRKDMDAILEEKISTYSEEIRKRENAGKMLLIFLLNWENSEKIFKNSFLEIINLEGDNIYQFLRAIKDVAKSADDSSFEVKASAAVQNAFVIIELLYKSMLKSLYLLCSPEDLPGKVSMGYLMNWFIDVRNKYKDYQPLFYFLDDAVLIMRNAVAHFSWELKLIDETIIFRDYDKPPVCISLKELYAKTAMIFNWITDFIFVYDYLKTVFYDIGVSLSIVKSCGDMHFTISHI